MNIPVEIAPRKKITRNQMRGLIHNQNGACPACGGAINIARGDVVEVDHRIPLAMGGTNDWSNLEALHQRCHAAKTPVDIKAIAKAKRVAKRHAGEARLPRHQIPGGKNTRVQKKMDGSVICRATGAVLKEPNFRGKQT